MIRGDVLDDEGGGHTGKKKREKKGFKADRYENYRLRCAKAANDKGSLRKGNSSAGKRVKTITFDEDDRREYLSMHKRKNERRVKAFVEAKQKTKRENARTRRAQREEARQAYNRFAAVPILPDFTYRLPVEGSCGEEGDEICEGEENTRDSAGAGGATERRGQLLTVERTTHVMPAVMSCGTDIGELSTTNDSRLDGEFVTVEVRPLGTGRPDSNGGDGQRASLPANNFSDLPAVVEQELLRLKKEMKGPARTNPRVRVMKELEKIRKIRKHSRKGHGKKSAKGKKKNRKR